MRSVWKKYLIPGIILIVVLCALTALLSLPGPGYTITEPSPEMLHASETVTQDTLDLWNSIAGDLRNLADNLTDLTPDDPLAQEKLYEVYEQDPLAAGVAWVDAKTGTTLTVPVFSLTYILASPEISQLSESSFANETFLFIGPINSERLGMMPCFAVPVYDSNGTYSGFVLMAYAATLMQSFIPKPVIKDQWVDIWIVTRDGTLVYHSDTGAIGQNLRQGYFVTKYPELKDGILYMVDHPSGAITYRAYDLSGTQIVEKTGVWQTVFFGGQELRVVVDSYTIPTQSYPYVGNITLKEQEEIVHAMYRYARREGMEKAVAEFNDPNGAFSRKGYDLFAYRMDGTALVSAKEVLIGENRLNYRDAYGVRPINSMVLRAGQGGGYVQYYRIVPYTDHQAALTVSYIRPVNEQWFVGASRAINAVPRAYNISKREDVTKTAQIVHNWVTDYGKETALAMIMDPAQEPVLGTGRILAVSYNGTLLADNSRKDAIGKDIFYLTDRHGASTIRESVMMAKQGGGYLYLEKDIRDTEEAATFLVYVEPVNDDWCILSMIHLESYNPFM